MSLRSDCLLAITGIFPTSITPKDHAAATSVPRTWERRLRSWAKGEDAEPFEYVEPKDMEKIFTELATDPAQATVDRWINELGVADADLQAGFYPGLVAARKLIVDAWPKFTTQGPAGAQILPLSEDDAAEMWSLVQVLDDPDRILDEMDSLTLTPSQADAFRKSYPDLYKLANDVITNVFAEKRAKEIDWSPGWERESVLNTFRGNPPEEPVQPAPPAPKPAAKFEIDSESAQTQAEVSAEPKRKNA